LITEVHIRSFSNAQITTYTAVHWNITWDVRLSPINRCPQVGKDCGGWHELLRLGRPDQSKLQLPSDEELFANQIVKTPEWIHCNPILFGMDKASNHLFKDHNWLQLPKQEPAKDNIGLLACVFVVALVALCKAAMIKIPITVSLHKRKNVLGE
jgi:hypothetical protein